MIAAQAAVLERDEVCLVPARARDFERLENAIADRVLGQVVDPRARPVHLRYRGRNVIALPLDTRRFVQAMARHLSLN